MPLLCTYLVLRQSYHYVGHLQHVSKLKAVVKVYPVFLTLVRSERGIHKG